MKKIFTLLFFVGAVATSFAQKSVDRKDQYAVNKSSIDFRKFTSPHENIYSFSAKERDHQIDKINKAFELKIKSIKSNRRINRREKKESIKKAKSEQAQQIQAVNAKFNSQYNNAS